MKCLICGRETEHASGMCSEKCWKAEELKQLEAKGYFVPPLLGTKVIRINYKDRTEEEKVALAQSLCNFLNELVQVDADVIHSLMETRICCNDKMAEHPTVQVSSQKDSKIYSVGLLGILNGFVGVDADQWGYIAALYDDETGKLTGFDLSSKFERKSK